MVRLGSYIQIDNSCGGNSNKNNEKTKKKESKERCYSITIKKCKCSGGCNNCNPSSCSPSGNECYCIIGSSNEIND